MKRLFLCLAFVLMASANSIAQELIPLSVSKEENIPIGKHIPWSHIRCINILWLHYAWIPQHTK